MEASQCSSIVHVAVFRITLLNSRSVRSLGIYEAVNLLRIIATSIIQPFRAVDSYSVDASRQVGDSLLNVEVAIPCGESAILRQSVYVTGSTPRRP